jgi:hypothetical protein
MESPLLKFVGHVNGREAEVAVHEDRVEWHAIAPEVPDGEVTGRRAARRARNESGCLMLATVSSVTVWRATAARAVVGVTAPDTAVEFRVSHEHAAALSDEFTRGMLSAAATAEAPLIPQPRAAVEDQVRMLGVLYAAGLLTTEQFDAERDEILAEA